MITFEKQLEAVVREYVHSYNRNLDSEFEEQIIRSVVDKKLKELASIESAKIVGIKVKGKKVSDLSKIEPNGVWLYREPNINEWIFERYETIEQAIRHAINYIEDIKIICNGEIVDWDIIDNYTAIYADTSCCDRFVEVNIA